MNADQLREMAELHRKIDRNLQHIDWATKAAAVVATLAILVALARLFM